MGRKPKKYNSNDSSNSSYLYDLPDFDFDLPELDFDLPDINYDFLNFEIEDLPEFDFSDFDLELPELDFELPELDFSEIDELCAEYDRQFFDEYNF